MPVHENVGLIREAKGISKTFMAKGLGMSLQGYRYLENGSVKLDVERLKVIAKLLGEDSAIFFNDKLTKSIIDRIERIKKEA